MDPSKSVTELRAVNHNREVDETASTIASGTAIDWSKPTQTVPDACRVLGISRTSGYKGVAAGQIPSIRVGGRVVIPTAALRRLLELDDVFLAGNARDGP